ncbi:MAG: protein kinase [Candidatus Melainabacteria bacterium]|nr:protein kinase [Candidatus Melainabacteria bacterium]
MSHEPDICPKCQLPLEKAGSGRLTQWIMVCTCNVAREEAQPDTGLNICGHCGKHIEEGRPGTLTQWIFRADLCSCASPLPRSAGPPPATDSREAEPGIEPEEEPIPELELDREIFPYQRYAPLSLLGRGASGTVYLCRDRLLNKKVAIKILHNLSPEQIIAFQQEARNTSQLVHPSIVRVLDFGITGGSSPFMVMEYFPGQSLDRAIKERTVDPALSLRIFMKIAEALTCSHSQGLFHRDVKPSNILFALDQTGGLEVRLIDFGVGALKKEMLDSESQSRIVAGTPAYMSPDIARGEAFDEACEVYSVGCVLFEALTGRPPFIAGTPLELLTMHDREPAPAIDDVDSTSNFPAGLKEVVAACLEKDREKRFKSTAALKEAIAEIAAAHAPEPPPPAEIAPAAGPPKSRRLLILVFMTALLLVSSFIILTLSRPGEQPAANLTRPVERDPPNLKDAIGVVSAVKWQRSRGDFGDRWMSGTSVTDADFAELREKNDRRAIGITFTDLVTGEGFKHLENDPVEVIEMQSTAFNDEGMRCISRIKTLEVLRICMTSKLTARGFGYLSALPALRHVDCLVMPVPEGAVEALCAVKSLRGLSFYNSKNLKKEDIEILRDKKPDLEFLDLSGTCLSGDIVPIAARLENLTDLRLNDLPIGDEHLEKLGNLERLTRLDLKNCDITDIGLARLGNCRALRILDLTGCDKVTRKGVARLKRDRPLLTVLTASESLKVIDELEDWKP